MAANGQPHGGMLRHCPSEWGRQFAIRQGVRQGGVGSTHLYKMFLNPLLRRLEKTGSGYAIQGIPLGTPTCADDVLLGIGFAGLHLLLDFCHVYSEASRQQLRISLR